MKIVLERRDNISDMHKNFFIQPTRKGYVKFKEENMPMYLVGEAK